MEILSAVFEVIRTIIDLGQWIKKKRNHQPPPPEIQEIAIDTDTSILSLLLKPLKPFKPFFLLFTERIVIILSLGIVIGITKWLNLDERIAAFFVGIIFTFTGIGSWLLANKNKSENIGCLQLIPYMLSLFFLLFGGLMTITVLMLIILGMPLSPPAK